jgi:uncharacterized protein
MSRLLVAFVRAWQLTVGAWLRPTCRFYPSCSGYAIQALQRHGALAGSYLAARRIVRCGPWCEAGEDPVPLEKPGLFTHLTSFPHNNKT